MTEHRFSLIERLRAQAARRLAAAGVLNAEQIRDRLIKEFERNVRDGVAPDDIHVLLNPRDYARLAPDIPAFRADMVRLFEEKCRLAGYTTGRNVRLHFGMEHSIPTDTVSVAARFTRPRGRKPTRPKERAFSRPERAPHASPPAEPRPHASSSPQVEASSQVEAPAPVEVSPPVDTSVPAPTKKRFSLRLPGGEHAPVSHTPFAIGRASDNDLVLASFAVSRYHAELTHDAEGLILRDMGSRNGVMVDGERRTEVRLGPGRAFVLGDIELHLEESSD